jgi:hypothetical protein
LFSDFKIIAGVLHPEKIVEDQRKYMIDALFGVKHETRCLVEIMDIQDELTMVKSVLTQQKDVLDHLARLYSKTSSDDDEPRLKKDEWTFLKRLLPLLDRHAGVAHVQPQLQPMEAGRANVDKRRVEHPNANEEIAQLQPREGGIEGGKDKEGDGIEIEEGRREQRGAKEDEQDQKTPPKELNQPKEAHKLEAESQSVVSNTETCVLKSRSLLQETIDLVGNNIKSVDHMLQHAREVQEEVYMRKH